MSSCWTALGFLFLAEFKKHLLDFPIWWSTTSCYTFRHRSYVSHHSGCMKLKKKMLWFMTPLNYSAQFTVCRGKLSAVHILTGNMIKGFSDSYISVNHLVLWRVSQMMSYGDFASVLLWCCTHSSTGGAILWQRLPMVSAGTHYIRMSSTLCFCSLLWFNPKPS